jgi:peptidoglycan/LPS O-acetylase OafA/YrhL
VYYGFLLGHLAFTGNAPLRYFLYAHNWLGDRGIAFMHFWSLCVEEQVYLVWPCILLLGRRRALTACWVLIAATVLVRSQADSWTAYHGPRYDSILIGALIALGGWRRWMGWVGLAGAVATTVKVGALDQTNPLFRICGFFFLALTLAGIVWWVVNRKPSSEPQLLETPLLRAAGKYSYAAYVFHWPIAIFVWQHDRAINGFLLVNYVVLGTIASFTLAFLSFHLVEKHFLKLKR